MQIRAFQPSDTSAVILLWKECGLVRPWNDPQKDIQRKLAIQPDLFLVGLIEQKLVATVMAGYEGHRGWINYLAVAPDYQRQGIGQVILTQAETLLREMGCPKISLQIRSANRQVIEFYQRLGYGIDDVVSLGKRLEHDQLQ